MSKITAQYVDTCLPCYLQDGHNRPGETLLLASLGSDLATTVEELMDSMDDDCGLPESVSNEEIARAVRGAIDGVDLRYVDEEGNRQDEPAEDRDSDEPYVYVVLRWDAEIVKVVMEVEIEFYAMGEDPLDIAETVQQAVGQAAGQGLFTSGLDSEVKSWGANARVGEALKWITLRDPNVK